eukprot:7134062-Pyramimonas_sp.AAC.1
MSVSSPEDHALRHTAISISIKLLGGTAAAVKTTRRGRSNARESIPAGFSVRKRAEKTAFMTFFFLFKSPLSR